MYLKSRNQIYHFLVKTDLNKMKSRRKLSKNELLDIQRKLKIQNDYLKTNNDELVIIDNNNEVLSSIRTINNKINDKLCMSNL